jgi:hypothetical protein
MDVFVDQIEIASRNAKSTATSRKCKCKCKYATAVRLPDAEPRQMEAWDGEWQWLDGWKREYISLEGARD